MSGDKLTMTRRAFVAAGAATAAATAVLAAETPLPSSTANIPAPQGLATIPQVLQASINAGGVPGALALIWRKGEVIQVNTTGLRNVERQLPVERTTIFRIASMTKPITVVTALTLLDAGKMRLDDPITKWAPEFANLRVLRKADGALDDTYAATRPLTIEDLMTHRAGMSYFSGGPLADARNRFGMGIYLGLYRELSEDDWMKAVATLPVTESPGERFNYGLSMDVLGVIVGRAAKTGFRQAVQDRVCGPLGMKDTDFWIPPEKRDRQAELYIADPTHKTFLPVPTPSFDPGPDTFVSGGGGLVTTADDYLTFARMLLGKGAVDGRRILKAKTVELMLSNRLTAAQRKIPVGPISMPGIPSWDVQGFGLGVALITDPVGYAAKGLGFGGTGSFSWSGMYGGWWQADPEREMVLLWLVQAVPGFIAGVIPGAPPAPPINSLAAMLPPGTLAAVAFQKQAYATLPR